MQVVYQNLLSPSGHDCPAVLQFPDFLSAEAKVSKFLPTEYEQNQYHF